MMLKVLAISLGALALGTANAGAQHCPASGSKPAACHYTPAALKAMGERGKAEARFYGKAA